MSKARLIKKDEIKEQVRKPRQRKPEARKTTVRTMMDWLETQRQERPDPRKAFAALFSQVQAS